MHPLCGLRLCFETVRGEETVGWLQSKISIDFRVRVFVCSLSDAEAGTGITDLRSKRLGLSERDIRIT